MYVDIDASEITANKVRSSGSCHSCGLITSAETLFKKVRKAFQYMIYHLRMNSVTGLIDTKENTMYFRSPLMTASLEGDYSLCIDTGRRGVICDLDCC